MEIQGLNNFKKFFKDDTDKYILIGGTATILNLDSIGLSRNRGTKDLDIVLVVDLLDTAFIDKFKKYIELGGYKTKQANGKPQYYRFENPKNTDFPKMIEILSKKPDVFDSLKFTTATKLTIEEEMISLSALILDDEYYQFILDNNSKKEGILIADMECLVILKIRAYNDLKQKKEDVDSKIKSEDIAKHKNDIFRLAQNFNLTTKIKCTEKMMKDIKLFKDNISNDPVNLNDLGVDGTVDGILELIINTFEVDSNIN